jgi:hypothetical protein
VSRFIRFRSSRLRRSRGRALAALVALCLTSFALLASSSPAVAGPVADAAGFEGSDGNLAPEAPINFDWNSFAPTTWIGTSPTRTATDSAGGWDFTGLEDWQATGADSAFAGGTKQDNACASVITQKAPNKDDLKRYYLANKLDPVSGDIFLALAWVRIPQNTTSASAHVGFEFNQSKTPCATSPTLVQRTAGDLLIVYDFEGGSTDPRITLRKWVTSGGCEVGSSSPPCWGPAADLTASGFAEAAVNVGTPVLDQVADPDETLQDSEFGEAIINLSDAGVFTPGECVAFGKTFAVSRSSGNSAQAQMKDLVGPGDINIQNCGSIIINKQTVPSPDPTGTSFGYTTTGGLVPATFSLLDGGSENFQSPDIQAGSYSVTEDDPSPDFALTAINCTSSGSSTFTPDLATRSVSIELEASETVECTFVNTLQTGAILVTKTRKHAADGPGDHPHAGVDFTVNGVTKTTDTNGEACFDGLVFGDYTVHETVPAGYAGEADKTVTVDNVAFCTDDPYGGETVSFSNTPLTNVTVSVDSQVDGGTASTVECAFDAADPDMSTGANGDGSITKNDLEPGTYTCTIVIDP